MAVPLVDPLQDQERRNESHGQQEEFRLGCGGTSSLVELKDPPALETGDLSSGPSSAT